MEQSFYTYVIIGALVAGLVSYIGYVMFKMPGVTMQKKFIGMGTLKGRTYQEIIDVVGKPNMITGSHKTWSAGTYSITLGFDDAEICIGVFQEFNINY